MAFKDYYQILGLQSSASEAEIRRAYRILARRYHPDVNPGKDSASKFQAIAEAYRTLNDPEKRRLHDLELIRLKVFESAASKMRASASKNKKNDKEFAHQVYAEQMRRKFQAQSKKQSEKNVNLKPSPKKKPITNSPFKKLKDILNAPLRFPGFTKESETVKNQTQTTSKDRNAKSISIIEVSLSVYEAISGTRKTLEVENGQDTRKISVNIPSGVFTGSMIRMRSDKLQGEELVLLIKIAQHPYLHIDNNGLTVTLPLSINEAYAGTAIQVPTLEDPIMLKIPPLSQNGSIIRLNKKGPAARDGDKMDILYKIAIHGPSESLPPHHAKLLEEIDSSYAASVRMSGIRAIRSIVEN